jgi:hypothetical protein
LNCRIGFGDKELSGGRTIENREGDICYRWSTFKLFLKLVKLVLVKLKGSSINLIYKQNSITATKDLVKYLQLNYKKKGKKKECTKVNYYNTSNW